MPLQKSDQEHRTASLPPPLQPIPLGFRHSSHPTPAHSHRRGRWKVSSVLFYCPGWCLILPSVSRLKWMPNCKSVCAPRQNSFCSRCPCCSVQKQQVEQWLCLKGRVREFHGAVFCSHLCSCHTLCVVSSFHSTSSLWTCLLCIKTVVYSSFLSDRLEPVFHCFLFVYGSVLVKLNLVTS